MGHYPFEWQEDALCFEDFLHFHKLFSSTILQLIPFAYGPVTFLAPSGGFDNNLKFLKKPKYWLQYRDRVFKRQRALLASEKPVLFLPIWDTETIIGVAAIEGVDDQFTDTLSEEWLSDRGRIISREFFLLKQLAYDPFTGMLNARHLRDALHNALSGFPIKKAENNQGRGGELVPGETSLLLLEIHPRANNAEKALHYIASAGYYLESFLGQDVLHHLGSGIFGLIGQNMDEEQARKLGKNILSWFRREGFSRVHIGINTIRGAGGKTSNKQMVVPAVASVLEQTWNALRKARGRAPFALCTFSSISSPQTHPLRKFRPAVMAKLRKMWSACDSFSLLLISQDREQNERVFPRRILSLLEHQAETVIINKNELFVFIANTGVSEALSWSHQFRKSLPEDPDNTYSIGIAFFPCIDFSKSDIPQNARKALLHSGFYGPDTVTVFDGVSLNVSGDIYYGEGDIVRAVKEYQKGLALEPSNINLLNSLGEAYAQMNKTKKSRSFFEAVIQSDSKHYMALFNLGITYLTTGNHEQAIAYFEKALAVSKYVAETNQRNDLLLQLGKLYCRTGRYKKAVRLLEKEKVADKAKSMIPWGNSLLRYLGEAYMGAGSNKKAITVLQRSISYSPHDAYALSMLGELYARENQGDDIALSLCQQAVNVDDRHWKHWYRLGWIHYRMAQYELALDALKECLHRDRKNPDAAYLSGQVYEKLDARPKAAAMYRTALRIAPEHKSAAAAMKRIMTTKDEERKNAAATIK